MKTIFITGTVNNPKLSLLTGDGCVGTLCMVNRPLLAYTIHSLQSSVRPSLFALGSSCNVKALNQALIAYLDWHTRIENITRIEMDDIEETLWLRDDVLYDVDFAEIAIQLRHSQHNNIALFADGQPVLFYQQNNIGTADNLPQMTVTMSSIDYCQAMLQAFTWHRMELTCGQTGIISSPTAYHASSMALLAKRYTHLEIDPQQSSQNVIKGWHSQIDEASLQQSQAYVGDCVRVHKSAHLHGQVILCQGSYVDRCAEIRNSIIMTCVYIGPLLNINNAIVTGHSIIRVDSGAIIPIENTTFTKKMTA